MSKLGRFEDLTIFQMARSLCRDVYAITKQNEFKKDTRFVQQIHAAAGSLWITLQKAMSEMAIKSLLISCILPKAHVAKFAADSSEPQTGCQGTGS